MPGFDKTGPQGKGSKTGRGMGLCNKNIRSIGLMGRCCGYGRGLGKYFGLGTPMNKAEQLADLQAYKKALQEELEDVEKELASVQ